jgi:ferric-dicitrate binding protein FerR (iron transport regulator)
MSDDFTPGLPEDDMLFSFRKKKVSKEIQENNWKKVEDAISNETPVHKINWLKTIAIAASVALIVATGVWYATTGSNTSYSNLYKTTFAQTKQITLPDGSKVTLNANSELKLSADWSVKEDRQVWLNGEAYFEVEKKSATHQKFIVHTKDIDVEVLGTKFNVNTRHEKSVVSLEEGKIKLSLNGETKLVLKKKYKDDVIEMKPGEVVKLDTASGINLAAEQNVSFHSGWIRNEFHFNNTSLKDISTLIKDTYGYTVVVQDEEMLKRTISGDLRANNLQELVDVIKIAFKLKMIIENKTIQVSQF